MSARQLRRWQRFAAEEPFGEERADWRAGQVAAQVARSVGLRATATDYMLRREPRRQSAQEIIAIIEGYARMIGHGVQSR